MSPRTELRVPCVRCNGYGWVDNGRHYLDACTLCGGNGRMPAEDMVAPWSFERCPVHGRLVKFNDLGHRLGVCDGCAVEAAQGIATIKEAA